MNQEEKDEELKELKPAENMAEAPMPAEQFLKECKNEMGISENMNPQSEESLEEILRQIAWLRQLNAPEREMEARLEKERKEVAELEKLKMERDAEMAMEKEKLLAELAAIQQYSNYLESLLPHPVPQQPTTSSEPSPSGEDQDAGQQ
ncbi:unnamed protein product [Caenorhabditis sp. 36 PRJEB53466]|nr:unnamed protein product [Caenorhabditis sp. 36 PRJEB53466]